MDEGLQWMKVYDNEGLQWPGRRFATVMNTARFYPRKTRFTPDSATHASRDLRRHSAAAPPTELRRSHRKRDQNHRNSGALVLRHRKRPKLPKADAPTPARHISTTPTLRRGAPDRI